MSIYKQKIPQTIIRHPSRDKELERMPIDQIKHLALQCLKTIEEPTPRLIAMFSEVYQRNSHDKKEYIDLYKLARFEKVRELQKEEKE